MPYETSEAHFVSIKRSSGATDSVSRGGQRAKRGRLATPAAAMEEPRAGQFAGAKQGAERAALVAFDLEGRAAVWQVEHASRNASTWSLQQAFLDGVEELFGLLERQAQMLDTLVVFLQGDNVGDGFFLAIIVAHDELQFHTHGGASPGSGGGGMMQAILPEFVAYPQHLHALPHPDAICRLGEAAGAATGSHTVAQTCDATCGWLRR